MAVDKIDRSNLGYLGEDYQYKLVKEFMEDKYCFNNLVSIIDQNMFTSPYLRTFVGVMLEYHKKYNIVPSYTTMGIELRIKAHTQTDIELYNGLVERIKNLPRVDEMAVRDLAVKFFRQQNIIKAANKMLALAADGNTDHFDECEKLLTDALNVGTENDYEISTLYQDQENTLSNDFRVAIPTGIAAIDEVLNGGLGRGELGVIVGPSGFGKTSLTTAMAAHAATFRSPQNEDKGFKVLQIVFEDRIKQIQRKHFSRITQVEACNLSKDEYIDQVKAILNEYQDKDLIENNLRIVRFKSGEKTILDIKKFIEKMINQGFRPDLVILDYFECLKLFGPSTMSKWDKETVSMRSIEAMCNELNIAFWVPVQGNRDSISAELVTMDNAGGAFTKIQIAHIIMSITRSLEDIEANIATVSILKNRAGGSGKVIDNTNFNNGTSTITTNDDSILNSTLEFGKKREQEKEDSKMELQRSIFNKVKK